MLNLLSENPLFFVAWVLAILVALSTHEFTHAFISSKLGDPTAKHLGRVTLNPLAHIDWLGFLMLLLVGFGWGKPVPFNPYNLKYPKWGPTLVALGGPFANFVSVVFFGAILKVFRVYAALPIDNLLIQFLYLLILINLILMLFNLIPIPPLDGSKFLFSVLHAPKYNHIKMVLATRGPIILLTIIILDNIFGVAILSRLFRGIIGLVYSFF